MSTSAKSGAHSSYGMRIACTNGTQRVFGRGLTHGTTVVVSHMITSNDSVIQTVSVRVPRKMADGAFPEDLYPPALADAPAATIDRWLKGATIPPLLYSLRPEDSTPASGRTAVTILGLLTSRMVRA